MEAVYEMPSQDTIRSRQEYAALFGVKPADLTNFSENPLAFLNPDGTPKAAPVSAAAGSIGAGATPAGTSTATGGGFAPLPPYLTGVPQGIPGLNEFFDPNFGRTETMTQANENAIAGGWGGGGFAGRQALKLLDSERKANILAGHQILEPYLNREHDTAINESNHAAQLNQIAAEGAQALQRLQLSESGAGARLSAELAAKLQQQVLDGQQAMQRLVLTQAGETGRQNAAIGGNLASTLLSAALSGRGASGGGGGAAAGGGRATGGEGAGTYFTGDPNLSGVGVGPLYNSSRANLTSPEVPHWGDPSYAAANARSSPTTALGSSAIDFLLRKYGLLR